jgi:hypothetical protein
MKKLVATGVLGWGKYERQSKEYGYIAIEPTGYGEKAKSGIEPHFDTALLNSLIGKRVRLTALVRETRKSEHVGDLYLYYPGTTDPLLPTQPEKNAVIEIGVGPLQFKLDDQFVNPMLGVNTTGGKFQMDPEQLYKLHDQTVDLYVEETDDPITPPTRMEWDRDGTRGTMTGDGFIQLNTIVTEGDVIRAKPDIKSHGDGLFSISPPSTKAGNKFEVAVEKKKE